jgi:hypothetical protein
MSPTRAAGLPSISTVAEPALIVTLLLRFCGVRAMLAIVSPTRAAGLPHMSTVEDPERMAPPAVFVSPTLAAGAPACAAELINSISVTKPSENTVNLTLFIN